MEHRILTRTLGKLKKKVQKGFVNGKVFIQVISIIIINGYETLLTA